MNSNEDIVFIFMLEKHKGSLQVISNIFLKQNIGVACGTCIKTSRMLIVWREFSG